MRDIEAEVIGAGPYRQRRLTVGSVAEPQLRRVAVQVAPQDHPQQPPRRHEAVAVPYEVEAAGPRSLVHR